MSAYSDVILRDRPLGYWRLGESSGTQAVDSSGNKHHGTYSGGVTLGDSALFSGDSDTSATFDGVDGTVEISHSHAFNLTGPLSIEAWVVLDTTPSGVHYGILSKGSDGFGFNWAMLIENGSRKLAWRAFNGSHSMVTSTTALTLATLTHVGVVLVETQVKFYINGVLDATQTSYVGDIRDERARIGGFSDTNSRYFDGRLDEVAVYDYALSAERMAARYNFLNPTGSFGATRWCPKCKQLEVEDKFTPKCKCHKGYR